MDELLALSARVVEMEDRTIQLARNQVMLVSQIAVLEEILRAALPSLALDGDAIRAAAMARAGDAAFMATIAETLDLMLGPAKGSGRPQRSQ